MCRLSFVVCCELPSSLNKGSPLVETNMFFFLSVFTLECVVLCFVYCWSLSIVLCCSLCVVACVLFVACCSLLVACGCVLRVVCC